MHPKGIVLVIFRENFKFVEFYPIEWVLNDDVPDFSIVLVGKIRATSTFLESLFFGLK